MEKKIRKQRRSERAMVLLRTYDEIYGDLCEVDEEVESETGEERVDGL